MIFLVEMISLIMFYYMFITKILLFLFVTKLTSFLQNKLPTTTDDIFFLLRYDFVAVLNRRKNIPFMRSKMIKQFFQIPFSILVCLYL